MFVLRARSVGRCCSADPVKTEMGRVAFFCEGLVCVVAGTPEKLQIAGFVETVVPGRTVGHVVAWREGQLYSRVACKGVADKLKVKGFFKG